MKAGIVRLACLITGLTLCQTAVAAEQSPSLSVEHASVDISRTRIELADDFRKKSALYAATFQAGVYLEEPVPGFAEVQLWGKEPSLDMASQIRQGAMDESSKALQVRLREFFISQSEIAKVRVSIACSTNRCVLQFIELQDSPVPDREKQAPKLWRRLTTQSWYWEEFASNVSRFLPRDGSVWYQYTTLGRHSRSRVGGQK
jgi:hypothetical protein